MTRMKDFYESRSSSFLTRRTPVIIRLDGKAFHTYTKGLNKPFDAGLVEDMQATAIFLCEQIQGAKVAYTQSDEISILLTDFDTLRTDAWFGYNVQKMCSIASSLCTAEFNKLRILRQVHEEGVDLDVFKMAFFDARAFNIPKEEVANYFLARQQDAVRNSIHMAARAVASHKECDGLNSSQLQELMHERGMNWNNYHPDLKRGSTIIRNTYWDDELVIAEFTGDCPYPTYFYTENWIVDPGVGKSWYKEDDTNEVRFTPMKDIVVRNRWETVETPFTFKDKFFAQWLNPKE